MKPPITGTHVWLTLFKAARSVESHALQHVASMDMCLSDFAVLEVLLHKGTLPVNTIGKKVLLTSGSITTAIDRLESKKLVTRSAHPDDRRVTLVQLTNAGRKLIEHAFEEHQKALEEATKALSQEEKDVLTQLLKKLGKDAAAQLE